MEGDEQHAGRIFLQVTDNQNAIFVRYVSGLLSSGPDMRMSPPALLLETCWLHPRQRYINGSGYVE